MGKLQRHSITGVLIVHNDASLLDLALKTVAPWVDRLLVVDGAYRWVSPFCQLHGEDPERSTDEMLTLLNRSGIPYEVHTGVWESETHKRLFSIERAASDILMTVDSDELFDLDAAALERYLASGKVFGSCLFPLYFTPGVIGHSTGLGGPPRKPIFINKRSVTPRQVVDSLFLLVPDSERTGKLPNADHFKESVGVAHHVSSFRSYEGSYRRARFYNLLSMRVAGNLNLVGGGPVTDDAQFFQAIRALPEQQLQALDSMFAFHRISAALPVIKSNQTLVEAPAGPDSVAEAVRACFARMQATQVDRLSSLNGQWLHVFSRRSLFLDVTDWVGQASPVALTVEGRSGCSGLSVVAHLDRGLVRESQPLAVDAVGAVDAPAFRCELPVLPPDGRDGVRCVLELQPQGAPMVVEIRLLRDRG